MPAITDLRPLIEAKAGAPPVWCDAEALRSRLGYDSAAMRAAGYDPAIIAEHEGFNARLEPFIIHPSFGEYLMHLTPQRPYPASGVGLLSLEDIRQEIHELAPCGPIFPHGYLPFATSVGGNAVCFHASTGQVVWADHDSFGADDITYQDRATGKYHTVPLTPAHIAQAVVPLADDFEVFLTDLLHDRLERKLDELD